MCVWAPTSSSSGLEGLKPAAPPGFQPDSQGSGNSRIPRGLWCMLGMLEGDRWHKNIWQEPGPCLAPVFSRPTEDMALFIQRGWVGGRGRGMQGGQHHLSICPSWSLCFTASEETKVLRCYRSGLQAHDECYLVISSFAPTERGEN